MSLRREHIWFIAIAIAIVGIGLIAISRLSAPFARPAPHPKWANITQEPTVNVYMADTGAIQPMPLERYLEGVVAAEMDPDWPLEALKAQAIVARTFTIESLQRTGGVSDRRPGADVSTSHVEFQAYDASRVTDLVRQAVQETRGEILTYRGVPVRAWFHADAGGRTATPAEGLGVDGELPYLRSEDAPWTSPDTEWNASFSKSEVRAAAIEAGAGDPGAITTVGIGQRGPSGRALTIDLGAVSVPAPEFRLALDPERMRSTLLTAISLTGDRVTMTGRGFGHGVGMPQWSARILAEQGRRAEDIVRQFYTGTRIEQMWQ